MPPRDWIAFANPLARPLHQLGLELVVFACFALTLQHALQQRRRGDRYPLFQWLVILAYGITLELIAFAFYQNYEHAQFTVQLYHQKLPLYIPAVYVTFHYVGLKLVERLGAGLVAEALLCGFTICLLDLPFDITGVASGWWSWSAHDPRLAIRWLGVPVTSYYWYLTFGALFAGLCRLLRPRVEPRSLPVQLLLAPLVGVAIIGLGTLAFLPFHALTALGVPDGAIVAAHLACCAGLLAVLRARAAPEPMPLPWQITAAALTLYGWHFALLGWRWAHGQTAHPLLELAIFVAAAVAAVPLPMTGRRAPRFSSPRAQSQHVLRG
jgi:hypothetical protein